MAAALKVAGTCLLRHALMAAALKAAGTCLLRHALMAAALKAAGTCLLRHAQACALTSALHCARAGALQCALTCAMLRVQVLALSQSLMCALRRALEFAVLARHAAQGAREPGHAQKLEGTDKVFGRGLQQRKAGPEPLQCCKSPVLQDVPRMRCFTSVCVLMMCVDTLCALLLLYFGGEETRCLGVLSLFDVESVLLPTYFFLLCRRVKTIPKDAMCKFWGGPL